MHLRILDTADDDLQDIAFDIDERSGMDGVAAAFIGKLVGQCQRLALLDGVLGTDRSDLRPGLRSTPHGNYIIFFRYTDEAFEIVNVLRASRDITRFYDTD